MYRKNLQPVVYVTGDVAGGEESPVYAIMKMSDAIDKIKLPDGHWVKQYKGTTMPERTDRFSMKWDGEWHITVEVFRDLDGFCGSCQHRQNFSEVVCGAEARLVSGTEKNGFARLSQGVRTCGSSVEVPSPDAGSPRLRWRLLGW